MAIKVNGTTVIDDNRNLVNIASGAGGGTTLLATVSVSGAREISITNLDLSSYSLLYAFGTNIKGGAYYDKLHLRSTSVSTNVINRVAAMKSSGSNLELNFGAVIDLNTGYGFSSCNTKSGANDEENNSQLGFGFQSSILTSTTTVVIGHDEGNGNNWSAGTLKLYGA